MADEKISPFFNALGFKLGNNRTSWGATNGQAVMLRTWSDEGRGNSRSVRVFLHEAGPSGTTQFGRTERREHVRAIWSDGIPAYMVIVTPKPTKDGSRGIGSFRDDAVFPITGVFQDDDSIYATYGAPVPIAQLADHVLSHVVAPSSKPVPDWLKGEEGGSITSREEYAKHLAFKVREYLIDAATRGQKITYAEIFEKFDLNRMTVRRVLGNVGHRCLEQNEPILTALVVYKGGVSAGRCGPGFKNEFKVDEDDERELVFAHWGVDDSGAGTATGRDWTDAELSATVDRYREMLQLAYAGKPFVKVAYYRQLGLEFDRVPAAFARRMHNISHLLAVRDLRWLAGLKPLKNIGANVEPRLLALLAPLINELAVASGYADELPESTTVIEGAKKQVTVNAYERDATAKPRCIARWGTVCVVCSFDFAAAYGELGAGFIHVHHLKPIHTIGEAYELDPENDLRPVCPNCHSMLHRRKIALSIDELTAQLKWRFAAPTKDGRMVLKADHGNS